MTQHSNIAECQYDLSLLWYSWVSTKPSLLSLCPANLIVTLHQLVIRTTYFQFNSMDSCFIIVLFCFVGWTHNTWKFLGQGYNICPSKLLHWHSWILNLLHYKRTPYNFSFKYTSICVLFCWKLSNSQYLGREQSIIVYRSSLQPDVVFIFIFRMKTLRFRVAELRPETRSLPPTPGSSF